MERKRRFLVIFKRKKIKRNIPTDGLDIGFADKNFKAPANYVQGLKEKLSQRRLPEKNWNV